MEGSYSIKDALVGRLSPTLLELGFEWLEAFQQFRRKTAFGFQCIILSISNYDDLSILELHFGIRFNQVEDLAFPYTNGLKGFSKESMTLVVSSAKLKKLPFLRWELAGQNDVIEASKESLLLVNQVGLLFFQQYDSMEALDALFNKKPEEKVMMLNNPINRCIRGITIAFLSHRSNFEDLSKKYREILQNLFATNLNLKKYDELVLFLKTYHQN